MFVFLLKKSVKFTIVTSATLELNGSGRSSKHNALKWVF